MTIIAFLFSGFLFQRFANLKSSLVRVFLCSDGTLVGNDLRLLLASSS
jgi:hypothetical protein